MPRAKKVLKEVPIESSESENEEVATTPPPSPKAKKVKKFVEPKELSDKKLESLRVANEARLRKKIEREMIEKRKAQEDQERMLEEKIVELIGRHIPKRKPKPKKMPVLVEESSGSESEEVEVPKQRKPPRKPLPELPHEIEQAYEPPPQQFYTPPSNPLFHKIFS